MQAVGPLMQPLHPACLCSFCLLMCGRRTLGENSGSGSVSGGGVALWARAQAQAQSVGGVTLCVKAQACPFPVYLRTYLQPAPGHTLDSTNSAIPVLFSKAMNKTMTNPIPSNPLLKSKRHAENCVPALLPQDPHEDPLPHDLPLLTTHLEKESFKLL
eukprot:scaffold30268_cov20-Tisochrysis_lutea.AAC.1